MHVIGILSNQSALFVAGELTLGLSLLVFVGALIMAVGDRIRFAAGRK